jgi:hypothetical protein
VRSWDAISVQLGRGKVRRSPDTVTLRMPHPEARSLSSVSAVVFAISNTTALLMGFIRYFGPCPHRAEPYH